MSYFVRTAMLNIMRVCDMGVTEMNVGGLTLPAYRPEVQLLSTSTIKRVTVLGTELSHKQF